MNDDNLGALARYVIEMAGRDREYGYDEREVLENLEERNDSETVQKMEAVYKKVAGVKICQECDNRKFFDSIEHEYYCPVHD